MNIEAAKNFVIKNARPLELSLYKYFFENEDKSNVLTELRNFQKDDGGFDISWQWYTEYKEFETARNWWRPRLTIDKILFWNYV